MSTTNDDASSATEPLINYELALSGGGMRAAAFALGAVLYLTDTGSISSFQQISSVSGGSLVNGYLAHLYTKDPGSKPGFTELSPLAHRIAHKGAQLEKFGQLLKRYIYVALGLAAAGLLIFVATANTPTTGGVFGATLLIFGWISLFYAFVVVALVVLGARTVTESIVQSWMGRFISVDPPEVPKFKIRHLAFDWGFKSWLSEVRKSVPTLHLSDIRSPFNHVWSATELYDGEQIHFSQAWIHSASLESSDVGDIRIDEVVRASAAFPGVLPSVKLARDRLSFASQRIGQRKNIEVVDGGVRDNLGHVFNTLLFEDSPATTDVLTSYGRINRWIAIDSSAPRGAEDLAETTLARIPLLKGISQLTSFPRIVSILSQSNSEARSVALHDYLVKSNLGFVVKIEHSPFDVCTHYLGISGVRDALAAQRRDSGVDKTEKYRALAVVDLLKNHSPSADIYWSALRNRNQERPTTLQGLGAETVCDLMQQGYVLMMTWCHIVNSWPLTDIHSFSTDRLMEMLRI